MPCMTVPGYQGTLVVVPGPGNWYTTYCFCHSTSKLRSVYLNKQFNTGKIISVHDDGRQDETSTGVTVMILPAGMVCLIRVVQVWLS